METTLAICDFCDTYFPVFLTLYLSLLAVILTEFCEGKWRRKTKDSTLQPGTPQPPRDNEAGSPRTENKPDANRAVTKEEK